MGRFKRTAIIVAWLTLLSGEMAGSLRSAAPLVAPFYPLNGLYLMLPPAVAQFSLALLENALWLSGLYLLARALGATRLSALLSATLGGAARQALGLISPAAPWLPWLFLLLHALLRRYPLGGQPARLPWALLAAPVLAALFLGADRVSAFIAVFALAVLACFRARVDVRAAVLMGAALFLALGLSAPQFTVRVLPAAAPVHLPILPWQALGHVLTLYAWGEAWRQRRLTPELIGLLFSAGLMALGVDARAFWVLSWSLSVARGADGVRRLRFTHGPEDGVRLPLPNGVRRWLLLGTSDVALARLAVFTFWAGWLLIPLSGPAWLLGGIVLRVSRCPIYTPRWMGRRPVWEVLALGVSALPLLAFLPTALPVPEVTSYKAALLTWWSGSAARTSFFITFLSAMSMAFLAVLWLWRRFYGTVAETSDLLRVARNSTMPVALNLFNRGMDFVYAALLLLRILGPANAGDYSSAIVIYTWLEIVVNFGLDAILMREVARTPQESARYLYNAAMARIRLWAWVLPPVVLVGLFAPLPLQVRGALLMLYLGLLPATLCRNFDALFYAHEQVAYPALVSSIATFLKVSLGAFVLLSGRGIVYLAANALVTNLIVLGILFALAQRRLTPLQRLPDAGLRQRLLRAAWPLMLRDLLYTLYYRSDLVLLQVLSGSLAAGWYSIIFKFLDTIAVVPQYFALALFPVLARQAVHDRERFLYDYRLSVKLMLTLAFPIALTVTLFARELVLILGDVDYLPHSAIALRIAIWLILLNWINALGQYVLIALQRQKTLSAILALALVLSVVGNGMLMPRFGYYGAAFLKVALEGVVWALQRLAIRERLGWRRLFGFFGLIALICGGTVWLLYPLGRGVALLAALGGYGLLLWRLPFFSPEERLILHRLRPQRDKGVV